MLKRLIQGTAAALVVGSLSACAYNGGGIDNPLARRAVWFSFLAGEDIKQACAAGGADQYRLVYNGVWREQVRIYELGFSGPNDLDQRVIGANELSVVSLDDPTAIWRGKTGKTQLKPEQAAALNASFEQSGLYADPPSGLRMASDSFYWTAASCHQGRFSFNAWQYPSSRFQQLAFVQPLLAADVTGVAFNAARDPGSLEVANKQRDDYERWYIEAKTGGLVGVGSR